MPPWSRAAGGLLAAMVFVAAEGRAQDRGIFLLGRPQQRVEVDYLYTGRRSDVGGSSRTQRFDETYHFSIDYAVLHPNLLVGSAGFGLGLEQRDGDFTGWNLQHRISGTIYRRKPLSLSLYSDNRRSRVLGLLSDSYTVDERTFGGTLNGSNRRVPFRVEYSNISSRTSGLGQDFTREDWSVNAEAKHSVHGWSDSNLRLQHAESALSVENAEGRAETTRDAASFSNGLGWSDAGRRRSLTTALGWARTTGSSARGGSTAESLSWREGLDWQFGSALSSGIYLDKTRTKTDSDLLTGTGTGAFVQHRLADSLRTKVDVSRAQSTVNSGEEERRSWGVGLGYTKRLPLDGTLFLSPSHRQTVVDRQFDQETRPVFDEPHEASLFQRFALDQPGALPDTIVIRHANPEMRLVPYETPRDYGVETVGDTTLITIPVGSQIAADARPDGVTPLLVSYRSEVESVVKYRETTSSLSGSVGLSGGRVRAYGSWSETEQEALSPEASEIASDRRRTVTLGMAYRPEGAAYGLDYSYADSRRDTRQTVRADASWWRRYGWNNVSLSLSDSYSVVESRADAEGEGGARSASNTVGARTGWQRPLLGGDRLDASASYYVTTGDLARSDFATLGLNYDLSYGKFSLRMQSRMMWRFRETGDERQDLLWLKVTRYF